MARALHILPFVDLRMQDSSRESLITCGRRSFEIWTQPGISRLHRRRTPAFD